MCVCVCMRVCVHSKLVLLAFRLTYQAAAQTEGHSVMSEVRANQFLHLRKYLADANIYNHRLCPFAMSQRKLTGHILSQV